MRNRSPAALPIPIGAAGARHPTGGRDHNLPGPGWTPDPFRLSCEFSPTHEGVNPCRFLTAPFRMSTSQRAWKSSLWQRWRLVRSPASNSCSRSWTAFYRLTPWSESGMKLGKASERVAFPKTWLKRLSGIFADAKVSRFVDNHSRAAMVVAFGFRLHHRASRGPGSCSGPNGTASAIEHAGCHASAPRCESISGGAAGTCVWMMYMSGRYRLRGMPVPCSARGTCSAGSSIRWRSHFDTACWVTPIIRANAVCDPAMRTPSARASMPTANGDSLSTTVVVTTIVVGASTARRLYAIHNASCRHCACC